MNLNCLNLNVHKKSLYPDFEHTIFHTESIVFDIRPKVNSTMTRMLVDMEEMQDVGS